MEGIQARIKDKSGANGDLPLQERRPGRVPQDKKKVSTAGVEMHLDVKTKSKDEAVVDKPKKKKISSQYDYFDEKDNWSPNSRFFKFVDTSFKTELRRLTRKYCHYDCKDIDESLFFRFF
ncbi:hypothetical protein LOTGIDRAFT_155559 [Lottia gigantea]|uniref:Uncharacterized protein n=1 Tax=Lottia gigantea TaxID=225164 RepID=V3ZP05_LOTGI|nr:hypothetical protein LOTGIDRAFT_155559 [Lottia gigantea]ESO84225.1 hypothetical protein LOTGIDRAFT_155559 [Lottia gigantea]